MAGDVISRSEGICYLVGGGGDLMAGTVWILGAGFSKALGGPMLTQLLSKASPAKLRTRFKGREHMLFGPSDAALTRLLSNYGWERPAD